MGTTEYVTCIRFSLQLLIAEATFLIGRPRRSFFRLRIISALSVYFALASIYFLLLKQIPGNHPMVHVCFYMGLFLLTLKVIAFSYDLSWLEILFVGTGGYATEHIAFAIARIIQAATGWTAERIGPVKEYLIFRLLIYIITAGVIYFLLVRRNREKEEFKEKDIRMVELALLILLSAIVLSVFYTSLDSEAVRPSRRDMYCGMPFGYTLPDKDFPSERDMDYGMYSEYVYREEVSLLANVICPMYSMLCCFLVLMIEYYVFRENRLSRDNEMMEQLLHMANAQQKSTKEAIDIINVKCHDLKYQMKELEKLNNDTERSEYIEEMRKAISIYDATYHTGCEALDYILREKTLLSDEHHIVFSCMADGEALSFMNQTDMYALIGNALDNALERTIQEKEEQRIISLRIQRRGQMVMIHLENTCSEDPDFKEGLPVTTKADKNYHGFGVKSMRYIVRKYDGEMLMRVQDGKFILDIVFSRE